MTTKTFIRRIAICALSLFFAYALACTYLWARQGHFIFMPRREIKKTPANYQLPYKDVYVTVRASNGLVERIHGWWIPAQNPSGKTLLYLHGSALNIGANVDHVRRFHNLGFAVFIISYRGYGLSDGEFPSEAQMYADAEAAWNYLVGQKKVEPDHIFIYGHSIGGAIAIDLAVRHSNAAGLIVEATFTSIIDMALLKYKYRLLPMDLIVDQKFDSLNKVGRLKIPVLYMHGTKDNRVPSVMSRRLYKKTSSPKRLKFITGGGHNNSASVGGEDYLRSIREFEEFVREKSWKKSTGEITPELIMKASNPKVTGS
ncbi:MAG: alpha/beta fold hydrolase [Desulfobacterales bacterium]|jgi:dipeptidyl aminopeptidase/acylaminoacyl peptidase